MTTHVITEVTRFTKAEDVNGDVAFCGDGLTFRFVAPKPDYKSVKIHLASNPPAAPQVTVVTGMTGASDWYWHSEDGGEGWELPGWREAMERAERQLKIKRLYKRTDACRRVAIQEAFSERMTNRLIAEAHLDRQYAESRAGRARTGAPERPTNLYVPPECRRVNLGRYGCKEIQLSTKVPGSPSHLRWLRGTHKISRADLAEAAGVSTKTVARFETSELTWAKSHHHSVEATTAHKVREAGVAAATEAAIRTRPWMA